MPPFGQTIRRFTNNVSDMKKLAARDYEDMLQVRSLPCHDTQQTHCYCLTPSHNHPTLPPCCHTPSRPIILPCVRAVLPHRLASSRLVVSPPLTPRFHLAASPSCRALICHLVSPHPAVAPCPIMAMAPCHVISPHLASSDRGAVRC